MAAEEAGWGDLSGCEFCLSLSSHGSGQHCRAPSIRSLEEQKMLYLESALWSLVSPFLTFSLN